MTEDEEGVGMLKDRQRSVARELYEGKFTEPEILKKNRLSAKVLARWFGQKEFQEELGRLRDESKRQAEFIIARYGHIAALRLVELTSADKPDIARRAAVDLIDRCLQITEKTEGGKGGECDELSDKQVARMLATLARSSE
jgi:23S rRNA G2069 N7-methylase RlmK/C1962 C5-methylase RlmI